MFNQLSYAGTSLERALRKEGDGSCCHFIAKAGPAAPFFALHEGHVLIVGRVSQTQVKTLLVW